MFQKSVRGARSKSDLCLVESDRPRPWAEFDDRRIQGWRQRYTVHPPTTLEPGQVLISAGAAAIERYAESGGQDRLIQSIKSHLAGELFSSTARPAWTRSW